MDAPDLEDSQPPTTQPDPSLPSQQPSQQQQQQQQHQQQQPPPPTASGAQHPSSPTTTSTSAPRPRDARMIELLLTSQGVTSYESRVPQLLMDFAYRHTSSILSDAVYLSADPYTTHAGSRPSATSGATANLIGADASASANAIRLAIASRQGYQFRSGSAAGGLSKEWLSELAKERNKVALPKVGANEWAARLPGERFVLSGLSWGLTDLWQDEGAFDDDDEDDEQMEDVLGQAPGGAAGDALEDTGDGIEGGTMEDVFGEAMDEDLEAE